MHTDRTDEKHYHAMPPTHPHDDRIRGRLRRGSTRYGDDSNRELERCALLMRHGCELLGVPETPLMHNLGHISPFRLSAATLPMR